jgi:N-glycosylase/DNA lyase
MASLIMKRESLNGLVEQGKRLGFESRIRNQESRSTIDKDMPQLECPRFSLRSTLESGQFFRWKVRDGAFDVFLRDRVITVKQEGDVLQFEGAEAATVRRFFGLDHDLPAIHEALARDPVLRDALERHRGLRILRQDPWECLASFITSAASNIPRITRNVGDMAARFGTPPAFPTPGQMGTEAELRDLKLGFRARYLAAAARLAVDGRLGRIGGTGEKIREALMEFPGVGRKVADCVALFAYGRLEAFPVDTWVRKTVRRLYFRNRKVTDRAIQEFAARRFGAWAGYAQQVLFVDARAIRGRAPVPV